MDSISRNQSEHHREDLNGSQAVAKIKQLVGQTKTCFFCTAVTVEGSSAGRPMSVQQVDDQGNLWFLSSIDSHKNQEIGLDSAVTLYFQGSAHADFLLLHGRAEISTDRAKIDELWEPIVNNWFTEGRNDPRVTVIKVSPHDGYYWDTKHGIMVAGAKMMIGAMIGKTMDDSIEGKISV